MVVSIDLCSSSDDEDYISSSPDSKDSYADDEEDISSSSESEDSASDGDYAPSSDDEDSEDSATDGDYADESPLSLDRKENLGSDDPSDGADRSLVLRKAPFGRNYAEHPIFLDDEWWLNSTHASPSYRSPAVSSHRIYPGSSSSLMLHDSSYSNSVKVLNGSDDVGDDRVKDEPNDFGRSAANGIGMSSSTFSDDLFGSYQKVETDSNNDNVYAYEGPRSHSTLPPSMQSWNSINGAENGFGMQSHPNAESRPSGCDERAVYEEALEHISQKRKEEDLPEGVMSISLLKHQKIALAWMLARENSSHCPGGILADDQGLGKTVSTIALMQKERVQQCNFVSADSDSLELCAQSGTASTSRSAARPSAGTLVVVPASILKQWASEISAKVNESSRLSVLVYHGGPRTTDPAELAKYDVVVTPYTIVVREFDGGPLFKVKWYRVVLDEAQTIKNHWTKSAIGCCGLTAEKRWCLSGTPIQNKVDDVYSYFRFLKYQPYCQYDSFRLMIKEPIYEGSIQFNKLQTVLNIVQLRRTKEALLDGEPIIKIPPKEIQLKKIKFTQKERQFYLDLEEGYRQKFKDFDDAGTIKQNYTNILVLLLRLRQACDHPVLLKEDNHANLTNPGSIVKAKELNKDEVKKMLKKLDGPHLACMVEKCAETPENAVITKCCHIFCYECVLESLSEEKVCPFCKRKLRAELVFSRPVLRLCESKSSATTSSPPADKSSAEADELSSICEKGYISSKVQAAVDTLNSIFNTHAVTDSDAIESSSSEIAPPKAIVFSQWTGMLDLLELSLNSNFIKFRRLDGSMSLDVRGAAVEEFKTDPEVRVMLMSLKAGNLGLNMTAASHVILLDPWWNPYAEDQAVDRAHRIGQTRPVTVTRFTVNDTVEDRILALQAKKRKMVESALGEKSGGISTRLTVEDLGYLFNI